MLKKEIIDFFINNDFVQTSFDEIKTSHGENLPVDCLYGEQKVAIIADDVPFVFKKDIDGQNHIDEEKKTFDLAKSYGVEKFFEKSYYDDRGFCYQKVCQPFTSDNLSIDDYNVDEDIEELYYYCENGLLSIDIVVNLIKQYGKNDVFRLLEFLEIFGISDLKEENLGINDNGKIVIFDCNRISCIF